MRALFCALAVLASAIGVSWGQERGVSEKAKHEIERRGAMLETVHGDGKIRSDGMEQVRAALAVPPDDNHKFILHVIVSENCAPCEALKRDLEQSPQLAKWVKLERIKQANGKDLLQSSDESFLHVIFESPQPPGRKERFAGVKITVTPTLLLTPSLNGQWGDPAKVIRQLDGYNGKPGELDAWLTKSITDHARRFQPAIGSQGSIDELLHLVAEQAPQTSAAPGTGYTPYGPNPYTPVPGPAPAPYPYPYAPGPAPGPLPIDVNPVPAPAPATPSTTGLWAAIIALSGMLGLGGFVAMIFVVWGIYRSVIKSEGKTPLLTDDQFDRLKKEVTDAVKKTA